MVNEEDGENDSFDCNVELVIYENIFAVAKVQDVLTRSISNEVLFHNSVRVNNINLIPKGKANEIDFEQMIDDKEG